VWYADSVEIGIDAVAASDTGKTMTFTRTLPRGWSKIGVAARTSKNVTGALSNEILAYVGSYDRYTESFDTVPRFWVQRGSWARTTTFAKSGPASFTESPSGPYRNSARDTVLVFPTTVHGVGNGVRCSFWHAAFVDPTDTAFVEIAVNTIDGAWQTIGSYNASSYARWADATKGDDAWRYESIVFTTPQATDTVYARLRLKSNVSKQSDGWYIDDLSFDATTDVEWTTTSIRPVFPQPASTSCTIGMPATDLVTDVVVVSLTGEVMPAPWFVDATSLIIDLRQCASGVYSVRATTLQGTVVQRVVVGR
jgi:hypothetical protein